MPSSRGSRSHSVKIALFALLALAVSACASTANRQIEALERPAGAVRIVLMPLDVELYELTAAGFHEPKADWTEAAKRHLLAAFQDEQTDRRLDIQVLEETTLPPGVVAELHQIQSLHGAIGRTIMENAVPALALPTKENRFDWTLGPRVASLRKGTRAHYALFVHIRDGYSSAGRVALILVAGALGVSVPGATQMGFASLVDLRTGKIVWFNRLMRGVGDLRTADAAKETAGVLLTGFPR